MGEGKLGRFSIEVSPFTGVSLGVRAPTVRKYNPTTNRDDVGAAVYLEGEDVYTPPNIKLNAIWQNGDKFLYGVTAGGNFGVVAINDGDDHLFDSGWQVGPNLGWRFKDQMDLTLDLLYAERYDMTTGEQAFSASSRGTTLDLKGVFRPMVDNPELAFVLSSGANLLWCDGEFKPTIDLAFMLRYTWGEGKKTQTSEADPLPKISLPKESTLYDMAIRYYNEVHKLSDPEWLKASAQRRSSAGNLNMAKDIMTWLRPEVDDNPSNPFGENIPSSQEFLSTVHQVFTKAEAPVEGAEFSYKARKLTAGIFLAALDMAKTELPAIEKEAEELYGLAKQKKLPQERFAAHKEKLRQFRSVIDRAVVITMARRGELGLSSYNREVLNDLIESSWCLNDGLTSPNKKCANPQFSLRAIEEANAPSDETTSPTID